MAMPTLLHPAATAPAVRLPSWIMDLSLADVHAQVELRATKIAVPLPVYDEAVEKQLAYGVTEMVLDMSRMCDGSL